MSKDRFQDRFNGVEAFQQLTPEQQAEIGGVALELAVMWNGQDAYGYGDDRSNGRPFHAADSYLLDALHEAVNDAIPETIASEPLPIPSRMGGVCRRCGCSEHDACFPPCAWAEENLCTACAER